MRQLCAALVLVAACGALASSGLQPVNRSERSLSRAEKIVAGLEATSARQLRLVRSFTTNKTFTVTHGEQTNARVVAALSFTAPDVKVFTVLESRGSDFVRTQVIDRIMAAEIEAARDRSRARVAITSDNYEFGAVREDGDAFVVEAVLRRQDELLRGSDLITKRDSISSASKRRQEPVALGKRHPLRFDFQPVNGVWMQGRTRARVTIRWLGEYKMQSECGPYRMLLAAEAPTRRF
jgi:hypothetical protein